MKLAALMLLLFCACSVSATPAGDPRATYTAGFAAGTDGTLLQKVVDVYKQRLPGKASFRTDAQASTITIEMPVSAAFFETQPERVLKEELPAAESKSKISIDPLLPRGELAQADDEWLRLEDSGCVRGLFGSQVVAHAVGAKVRVFDDEKMRALLGSSGEFEMLEKATSKLLEQQHTTLALERERFDAWRKEHPSSRLKSFDTLARERGGPLPDTLWRRVRSTGEFELLMRNPEPRYRFGSRDIESVGFAQGALGYPGVSFELKKERAKDFGDWTESILGEGLAIVLDDEILTLATVRSRLPGGGIIEGGAGGYTMEEVKRMKQLLQPSGLPPLPLPVFSLEVEFGR